MMMSEPIIGLQMYSMKKLAEFDLLTVLEDVKHMGYDAVELIGYYTYKPQQIRKKAKKIQLSIPSVHVPLRIYDEQKMIKDFERSAKIVSELGATYIVIPWIPISEKLKEDELKYLVHVLGTCVSTAQKQKLQLVLHHYTREFKKYNETFVLDELLSRFTKDDLLLQLDTGSLYISGLDPFEICKQYDERTPLIHLRDITYGRKDCCLGQGEVEFKDNLTRLPNLDKKILFVEQQYDKLHGEEFARKNITYVRKLLEEKTANN